ncbi:MAG: beta-ketoacyl synthase N-terminal-like domain-containing protein [Dehalococcoidia bacterium]
MSEIAIIGMACLFPGAPDLATYWDNICNGVDAISDAPPERLDSLYFDEGSSATDRLYARRGGFVDQYATFDATTFGVMPVAAMGAEPDQLLTLQVAQRALEDAGYSSRDFPRERTSIILGRGNYFGAGMLRLNDHVRVAEQLVLSLRTVAPELDEQRLAEIKADFQSRAGAFAPDTAIGLVPNLVASRVANRLNLRGGAYTIDAACASSLVAVDQACHELTSGRSEMAIAGGVHLCQDPNFWSVLCQLGAVSRSQQIRPFDRRADGLLVSEGIGLLVLKERRRAERDGDRIYAVIRGSGVSSDGRSASIMAPAVEGQLLAISRAWGASGLDPASIGLIEAHGTATMAGDAAELETLERFFGSQAPTGERIVLGSVKSMIGHAMPAAGAAGLIKAALAVYHGVLPPSIHCEEPRDELAAGHFEVLSQARTWETPVRRAGVNAFGFGGVNSHVILEAATSRPMPARVGASEPAPDVLFLAAANQEELLALIDRGERRTSGGAWRLAVFDPTPDRIAAARAAVERGARRFGRDGIFFAPGGYLTEGGKLAFLFPGVEAAADVDVADVAEYLGLETPASHETDAEGLGLSSFEVSALVDRALRGIGARPDAIAGHSIGEWAGMLSSGMIAKDEVAALLAKLEPGGLEVPDVVFLAIGAGVEVASRIIAELEACHISHDNCAHQSIVCGPAEQIEVVKDRLREQRVLFEELPFRSGFHTPAFAPFVSEHVEHLRTLHLQRPDVALWSATDCAPYPEAPADIQHLFARHLTEPVRFRELVTRLWESGVRVFVQVGAGSLHSFVDDTLGALPHNSLTGLAAQRSGLDQLRRVAAALFVEGANLELQRLGLAARTPVRAAPMKVALGAPLIRIDGASNVTPAPLAARAPEAPVQRTETVVLSVDTYPELRDHCLFRQPPDWPELADRAPTVPMTLSIDLMREAASKLAPGKLAVGLEQVVASSWLHVAPPVEVTITATVVAPDRVRVSIGEYVSGTVVMGDRFPPAPATRRAVKNADPVLFTAETIYRKRWMFHGPAYQGLASVEASDASGIRGTLINLPARGALLDATGQLASLWIMQKAETDRVSLPVKVGGIQFFGPEPPADARVECEVLVRRFGQREVVSDITCWYEGAPYCSITGWEDWRFDTGRGLYDLMLFPERNILAEVQPEGFVTIPVEQQTISALTSLARRFLPAAAVEEMKSLRSPRHQAEWLYSRIAAKDAVRSYLFERGSGPIYPIEIAIEHDPQGKPTVRSRTGRDMRVSISHTDGMAAAIAAEGVDPGIDVELIAPRGERFASIAFDAAELEQLPDPTSDEWLTRLWCAKEAAGKARGTGLEGSPRTLPLHAVEGTRFLIDGTWVRTRRIGQYVIGWTDA